MTSRRTPAGIFRSLESLEARQLFSAVATSTVQERASVPVNIQQASAKPGNWILKVDGLHGKGAKQRSDIGSLVSAVDKDFKVTRWLGADGLTLVQTPPSLTNQQVHTKLKGMKGFKFVEPDFTLSSQAIPNDTYFSLEWGLNNTGQSVAGKPGTVDADIDAAEAWDITRGDGSAVVGVIDSGVDYNHPDLANAIWHNPGEIAGDGIDNDGDGYVDDTIGWDFFSNDNNPYDENGHGTHVAGTIAATGDNGTGVAGIANAKIMPLRFLGADGSGSTSSAIAAINYATMMHRDHGINIRVTNNSWGGGGSSQALYDAIKASADAGMLFVAAAGNGGSDNVGDNNDATPNYPANYNLDNIISVAATDSNDARASFSNYGTTTVDLAAPGVSIASTYPNNSYVYMDGTSMATPHVTGTVALALSLAPTASIAQVKSAILNGMDPVSSMSGKSVSGGRLNARHTLDLLSAPVTPPTPVVTKPAAPSALTASAISTTQLALRWTDQSSDETGFKIERSTNGSAWSQIDVVGSNATSYTSSGLRKNTTYFFRVRASNSAGDSGYTNVASAKTPKNGVSVVAISAASSVFSIAPIAASGHDLDALLAELL